MTERTSEIAENVNAILAINGDYYGAQERGIVPDLIRKKTGRMGNEFALALQQCGIYTLTVGSIFRGILDIYGTTNHAGVIYWWGGIGLFAVGILMECILHGKN